MTIPNLTLNLMPWTDPLVTNHRYKVLYGGRGSGKSWAVAIQLILIVARTPGIRVACTREIQKSIRESAKQLLSDIIIMLGLGSYFTVTDTAIMGGHGQRIFFQGLQAHTAESIRGWEDVDIVWIEEAQSVSRQSIEILYPTIRKQRPDGKVSEIWLTFNPKSRLAPAWADFCKSESTRRLEGYVRKVNYYDNPYFPDVLETERQITLRDEPERYGHIWLGDPDDAGEERKVLPYQLMQGAVDAWPMKGDALDSRMFAGLDVADTGVDRNALVARRGACVVDVQRWHGSNLEETSKRAHDFCVEHGVLRLYYDVGGIGAGVRDFLRKMNSEGRYSMRGVNFGAKVEGESRQYSHGVSNQEFFMRRAGQLAWAVRQRAQRTQRLLNGEQNINVHQCLFVDPSISYLDDFMAECTQPEWDNTETGKLVIKKQPEDDMPSPDRYDALVLAYAYDSRNGLRID